MNFPYLGRREDPRLLTGAGRYTSDWNLPGQLHGVFLRAEHAHAEITGLDASAALAAPGVVAVLTGTDTLAAGFHRTQALLPYKGRGGEALKVPPRPALAVGRVRFVGEPVALVVAETVAQAQDAAELLESTGQTESGLDQLARIGFDTLGLQTYLPAGPKESRARTIGKGWKAPQAAGVIHTDFEKGFIKAEVISFEDLVAAGSVAEARAKGRARLEGKDYVMQDGDVVEFRFNN